MTTPSEDSPQQSLLEELVESIQYVAGELDTLSKVLDDIRTDMHFALQHYCPADLPAPASRPGAVRVTSMPRDVRDPDFGARLNRLSAADFPEEFEEHLRDPEPKPAPPASTQRDLFDAAPLTEEEDRLENCLTEEDVRATQLTKFNRRQLTCALRDARRSLAHNGKRSFAGKEAKKEIALLEKEFHRRDLAVPSPGEEVTK